MQIKNSKDFWAGLMFIAVGLFFMLWAVGHYQMGTAVRMGPAYFPAVLGGLLAFLGAIVFGRSFVSHLTDSASGIAFRPKDVIMAAVVLAAGVAANYVINYFLYQPARYGLDAAVLALALLANRYRLKPQVAALRMPFNLADLAIAVVVFDACLQLSLRLAGNSDWGMLAAAAILSVLAFLYRPDAKPIMLITAAGIAYGYFMKPLGLIVATAALVFISALGGHEFKWKEVLILYLALIIFSILVFVKGLTLPFPICPAFVENCPIR